MKFLTVVTLLTLALMACAIRVKPSSNKMKVSADEIKIPANKVKTSNKLLSSFTTDGVLDSVYIGRICINIDCICSEMNLDIAAAKNDDDDDDDEYDGDDDDDDDDDGDDDDDEKPVYIVYEDYFNAVLKEAHCSAVEYGGCHVMLKDVYEALKNPNFNFYAKFCQTPILTATQTSVRKTLGRH